MKLNKTLVNLQMKKLISNKMRLRRYLTRCTRLGREIYTEICEESNVSNISEEYTAFRERLTGHVDRTSYDRESFKVKSNSQTHGHSGNRTFSWMYHNEKELLFNYQFQVDLYTQHGRIKNT